MRNEITELAIMGLHELFSLDVGMINCKNVIFGKARVTR